MGVDAASREVLRREHRHAPMRTATGMRAFHRMPAVCSMRPGAGGGRRRSRGSSARCSARRAVATWQAERRPRRRRAASSTPAVCCEQTAGLPARGSSREAAEAAAAARSIRRRALENYGIDSILAMNLTNQLEKTFGSLPKTLFFEYQTIRELAGYFVGVARRRSCARLFARAGGARSSGAQSVAGRDRAHARARPRAARSACRAAAWPRRASAAEPIAIVGLSGRYPAGARPRGVLAQPARRQGLHHRSPEGALGLARVLQRGPQRRRAPLQQVGRLHRGRRRVRSAVLQHLAARGRDASIRRSACSCSTPGWPIEDAGYTRASLQMPHEQGPGRAGRRVRRRDVRRIPALRRRSQRCKASAWALPAAPPASPTASPTC